MSTMIDDAVELAGRGQLDESVAVLRRAVAEDPTDAQARYMLAAILAEAAQRGERR